MRPECEPEELIACSTPSEGDAALVGNKSGPTRLGFTLLLKFRSPRHAGELPEAAMSYMAQQVTVDAAELSSYDWSGRTIKYHRAQIFQIPIPRRIAASLRYLSVGASFLHGRPCSTQR